MASLMNCTILKRININITKLFQQLQEKVILPNTVYESNITMIPKLDKDTKGGRGLGSP